MSPQYSSLAYADDLDNENNFRVHIEQHKPSFQLMGLSKTDITAIEDIVEFGGTLTVSF